jgi:hypothetical protein
MTCTMKLAMIKPGHNADHCWPHAHSLNITGRMACARYADQIQTILEFTYLRAVSGVKLPATRLIAVCCSNLYVKARSTAQTRHSRLDQATHPGDRTFAASRRTTQCGTF